MYVILLAMVLGHGDSSVLWQEVSEKAGLVHTIDASAWNPGTTGLFCISFTCDADKREAFVLYDLEEMTLAEVADALGAPLNTIHYRVQAARSILREQAERQQVPHTQRLVSGRTR